jgi:hypothetical protein
MKMGKNKNYKGTGNIILLIAFSVPAFNKINSYLRSVPVPEPVFLLGFVPVPLL